MEQRKTNYMAALGMMFFAVAATFGQSESLSTKKTYQPNGSEGVLTGTVSLSGTPPWPMRLDMSADPVCYENNPTPLTEFIVATNGRLANVLIYVKASTALEDLTFEIPANRVILNQRGCQYLPHVLGVQVNQTLEIRNGDNTTQNVHVIPNANPDWNQSQVPSSEPLIHKFTHSEIAVPVKDNQHPWKKAYVGVFAHPFFAVSESGGAFTIEGLPPGNYHCRMARTIRREDAGDYSLPWLTPDVGF
jgi:hypothetical protein